MNADTRAFIDACVLANYAVTDLLLRLAEHPRQYRPVWSQEVLDETYRTHVEKLGWPEALASSFQEALLSHFPEAMASGYEHLLPVVQNDPKDRHVLAAAVHARSDVLVTFNLKDFPDAALAPWNVEVQHPDAYLRTLYEVDDRQVVARVAAIAAKREESLEEVLLRLGRAAPAFSVRLLNDLDLA